MPKDVRFNITARDKTKQAFNNVQQSLFGVNRAVAGLVGFAGFGALANETVRAADKMTLMQSKLKLVGGEFDRVFRVAQDTRQGIQGTVELYTRLARATEEYGYSQEDVLGVTEAVSKAVVVSGASATEAEAAIIQLSQGLASGALRGDELRSVLEQMPRVARMIAEGMGITVGELRKFGSEGKLTTDVVMRALQSQAQNVSSEFEQMGKTVSQAGVGVANAFTKAVGEMDQMSNTSYGLVWALDAVASALLKAPKALKIMQLALISARAGFAKAIIWVKEYDLAMQNLVITLAEKTQNIPLFGDFLVADRTLAVMRFNAENMTTELKTWKSVLTGINAEGEKLAEELENMGARVNIGVSGTGKKQSAATTQVKELQTALKNVKTVGTVVSDSLESGFGRAFDSMISGVSTFGDVAIDIFKSVMSELTKMLVIQPLVNAIGGSLFGLNGVFAGSTGNYGPVPPGRASGGPVTAGSTYLVGERGPEILTMGSNSGTITANGAGGGTSQINVTIVAADARSFTDMIKRNPGAIVGPFIEALQGGNQSLRGTLRTALS